MHQFNDTYDTQYLDIVERVMNEGQFKADRTGVGTHSTMGQSIRVDISSGKVPLLTLRNTYPRNAIVENLWFISGSTDIQYLKDNKVNIWDEWVIPETAVFRDITDEEYRTAHAKLYPTQAVGEARLLVLNYRECLNWLRCKEPQIYQDYQRRYPQGATREELVIFAATHSHQGVKIRNQRLVSGSIGTGAYGSQWRRWEDTRLVKPQDVQKYLSQGYLEVARTPHQGGKVVITRTIDQLANAIEQLRTNPDSRRIMVTSCNPGKAGDCALPPCHNYYQFYTREYTAAELETRLRYLGWQFLSNLGLDELQAMCRDASIPTRALSIFVLNRSSDLVLGLPSNLFQYALLAQMVAHVVGMDTEDLYWSGVDTHIYQNHLDGVREMFETHSTAPTLIQSARVLLNPSVQSIDHFTINDIELQDYVHHSSSISFPIAI